MKNAYQKKTIASDTESNSSSQKSPLTPPHNSSTIMQIEALLATAATKRVLFVGERIRDVYHYVRPLGRPTKDAIVSVEKITSEAFDGGVTAAAKHAQAICKTVDVFSHGTVFTKTRFVEESHLRKLFEFYDWNGSSHDVRMPNFAAYDAVIVTDYGHGMMEPSLIEAVCHEAKYLAVNVQTNAGNYGFNLATKYPRADYLCVDEPEARLATQNRYGNIENSLKALQEIAPKVCITLGKEGAIGTDNEGASKSIAYTDLVVDTMGAGDAFFAVTACIARESGIEAILSIGNAAGAAKTSIIGHRAAVTKGTILEILNKNHQGG